jgi:hypothetical protein
MTTTFDQQENTIILHSILQGLRASLGSPAILWYDTTSQDKVLMWEMTSALALHGYDFQNIYDRYWQVFPYGIPEYTNLNMIQKDIVNLTFNMCRELTQGYGEILHTDFPERVTPAKAALRD